MLSHYFFKTLFGGRATGSSVSPPHYGKKGHCRAAYHCRAQLHGKDIFAVRGD
jgi:hypothetical protein